MDVTAMRPLGFHRMEMPQMAERLRGGNLKMAIIEGLDEAQPANGRR
jgi:hypothetical protein